MSKADTTVKKFDTATDKSTKALLTAVANLSKVAGEIAAQQFTIEEMAETIQINQATLNDLDKQLEMKVREHNADLALRIREDEEVVIKELLEKTSRALIFRSDLDNLFAERDQAQDNLNTAVAAAEKRVASALEAKHAAAVAQSEANHRVEVAEKDARISALEARLEHAQEQEATFKRMLDDERSARVAQSEAQARAAEANRYNGNGANSGRA